MKYKKISLLSTIIIVIGSVIGGGIFFKNKSLFSLAQGDFTLVIGTWITSGISIICLGLAIIEISSNSKTNTGVLEWSNKFMPLIFSESIKNFLVVFFLPITITTLPFFTIKAWQDAGLELSHIGVLGWSLVLGIYLLIVNLLSLRFSEISQWIFTVIQMIPLLLVPIIALATPLKTTAEIFQKTVGEHELHVGMQKGLSGLTPLLIFITGMPAIMFAFDGFYEASSIRKNMKQPKKNTKAILIALFIILIIYLFISISFGIGSSEGSIIGMLHKTPPWVRQLINILISVGVIATINGYIMSSISQFEDLNKRDESMVLIVFKNFMKKIGIKNKTNRLYSFGYLLIIYVFLTILFWSIGTFVWESGRSYKCNTYGDFYIYNFINLITNYNSLLIYLAISGSVIGGMVNRRTKRIKVKKSKIFLPVAIISSIFVLLGFSFTVLEAIVDSTGFNNANQLDSIIKLSLFLFFIFISLMLGFYEKTWLKKYHIKINKKLKTQEKDLTK